MDLGSLDLSRLMPIKTTYLSLAYFDGLSFDGSSSSQENYQHTKQQQKSYFNKISFENPGKMGVPVSPAKVPKAWAPMDAPVAVWTAL